MGAQRTDVERRLGELLTTAREALGLSVSFLARIDDSMQTLELVDTRVPLLPLVFQEGHRQKRELTLCQAVRDGRLPAVIPDLRRFPAAMELPAARFPRIRSYVSVPVVLSDGTVYGSFCGAGFTSDKGLTKRDKALMEVLAQAAAVVIEPEVAEQTRVRTLTELLSPVLEQGGPTVLLQPIVDLTTGVRIGAEALSRFPTEWGKAPDVCFADAHSVGLGHRLEVAALERAVEHLDVVSGYVALNVSPGTLLQPECRSLLLGLAGDRVLLELSEHDQVQDYAALHEALAPMRAKGLRLAIDDVGAGFSSLRHIVLTAPDVIKLDRSIVDGVSHDPVLTTLVQSLVDFAHGSGASVVAEGIETEPDAAALRGLGVDHGQGWFFGRPGPPGQLAPACEPVRESGSTPAATHSPA